ncbi:sialin-like [Argopecten irradians]|uniref:sialin-like n=1 Tax=Argopecten irradians TaxID=31199 RepID=UPI003718C7F0
MWNMKENQNLLPVESKEDYITVKDKITSCRWLVGVVVCLQMSCTMMLRMNMTMVAVCMKPPNMTVTVVQNGTNVTMRDDYLDNYVSWDSTMEGLLIAGYYIGLALVSLPFGAISGKVNVKVMMMGLTALMVLTSVVTPTLTFVSPYVVLATRIIVGITAGGLEPGATQLLSDWAPLPERAQMMVLVETANSIGAIFNFLLSGLICSIPVLGGWPFIYYIFGGVNLLSLVIWGFCVYNKPSVHPRITAKELNLIQNHRDKRSTSRVSHIPWMQMWTSSAFWGCVLGFITSGIIFMIMAICLPLYIEQVLKFDPTINGAVSALVFVGRMAGAIVFGYVADFVFSKTRLSIGQLRKLFQVTGLLGSVPVVIWLGYLREDKQILAVALMALYWFIVSAMNSGFRVNPADIAPRFAGLINGISITLTAVLSAIAPLIVAAITPNGSAEEWQVVFYGVVGVSVIGSIMFVLLASGDEQEWAKDPALTSDVVVMVSNKTDVSKYRQGKSDSESTPLINGNSRLHT